MEAEFSLWNIVLNKKKNRTVDNVQNANDCEFQLTLTFFQKCLELLFSLDFTSDRRSHQFHCKWHDKNNNEEDLQGKDELGRGHISYLRKSVKSYKWVGVNGVGWKWVWATIVTMVQWHGNPEEAWICWIKSVNWCTTLL